MGVVGGPSGMGSAARRVSGVRRSGADGWGHPGHDWTGGHTNLPSLRLRRKRRVLRGAVGTVAAWSTGD